MQTPALNSNDIYIQPAGDGYLLYAPLSGCATMCSEKEVIEIENALANGNTEETWEMLMEHSAVVHEVQSVDTITEMTILLNQVCNFTCSYCYSAHGRDKSVLNSKKLITVLDFFVDRKRGNRLSLTFSGGGDPMLSFNLLSEAVIHARQLADRQGIRLDIGVVTNGSTLTDEKINFIKHHDVQLVVSCDILPDVHNVQRSHYEVVASTIDRLCDAGLSIGLRSTITPLNVERMHEMVDTLHQRFPRVGSAAFEAVLSSTIFPDAQSLREFYRKFAKGIFDAIDYGRTLGIEIGNTTINNVGACKTRSCLGKLVVTPHGSLTACSRIASPTDAHYHDFMFGEVSADGRLHIDHTRYNDIMQSADFQRSECRACVARYHCSGGCLLAHKSLTKEQAQAYCDFNREIVTRKIIKAIS